MNILFIGDVVGSSGRNVIKDKLKKLKEDNDIDLCVANGENAAGGLGITGSIAKELYACGVDVITLGNHTWSKTEILNSIESDLNMIRPANVSEKWPGKGFLTFKTPKGNVIVINLLGRVGMFPADCPFVYTDKILSELKTRYETKMVIIDFHAEATSEKHAFARYFDGQVLLVVGTHTHVQTADETILERGTGFITDVGMTGPVDSVIGMDANSSIKRFVEKIPLPYMVAKGEAMLSFIIARIDEKSGRSVQIQRMCIK